MTSRSVVFAEPVRTAIGTFGGSLKDIPAPNLGATAIGAAVGRAGIRPDEVETVEHRILSVHDSERTSPGLLTMFFVKPTLPALRLTSAMGR